MKKIVHLMSLFVLVAFFLNSCTDSSLETRSYDANFPVYKSLDEIRASVNVSGAKNIKQAGKIYIKGNLLLINEFNEGVHIIDNSDPENPEFLKYIEIPGNVDIAVFGDILYADSYIDLLAFDISDLNNIQLVNRLENVFEQIYPATENDYPVVELDATKGVVTGWEQGTFTETVENYPDVILWGRAQEDMIFADAASKTNTGNSTSAIMTSGIGGSMARFSIFSHYLYALRENNLKVFDIATSSSPQEVNQVWTSWNSETLFAYNSKLFMGTTSGMFIYDLSDPSSPQYLSGISHLTACDPVVVEGNTAYVTIRTGQTCRGELNQLDVVDITTITSPSLIKSYPMTSPHGLGIQNGILFICDGEDGLKVYDASDPLTISTNQIAHFQDIHALDVIPLGKILLMIGEDGFYQYNIENINSIQLLSKISVEE